jgi:hypothetical protein
MSGCVTRPRSVALEEPTADAPATRDDSPGNCEATSRGIEVKARGSFRCDTNPQYPAMDKITMPQIKTTRRMGDSR